jgi:hypothetical protein
MSETTTTTPWYARFLAWFKTAVKALFKVAIDGVAAEAAAFVNDPANQQAALAAVKAAIDKGLRGGDAWESAKEELLSRLAQSGRAAAANWTDTLLQNSYFAVKNSVAALASDGGPSPDAESVTETQD